MTDPEPAIHHDTLARLIYMANQIGVFWESQPETGALAGATDHFRKFWSPAMRAQILAHVAAGGEGLTPFTCTALRPLPASKTS